MRLSIGVAGKGGTGKTTICGMLIRFMIENDMKPILAVDADSNTNLNEVLGLEVRETIGDAREEMKRGVDIGMTKDMFIEMKIEQAIVEANGYDLIAMGRPEGPGCYCAANHLLTRFLDRLIKNYRYIVIDNEAGMEHISRLTTNNIDLLFIISDPTRRGILSAKRILELTDNLGLNIKEKFLIVNQIREEQKGIIEENINETSLRFAGFISEDRKIRELDLCGKSVFDLNENDPSLRDAYNIFQKIL